MGLRPGVPGSELSKFTILEDSELSKFTILENSEVSDFTTRNYLCILHGSFSPRTTRPSMVVSHYVREVVLGRHLGFGPDPPSGDLSMDWLRSTGLRVHNLTVIGCAEAV